MGVDEMVLQMGFHEAVAPPPPSPGLVSGMRLRPYQEQALAAVDLAEEQGTRRQMLVMPTGAGKTVVFASLIRRRRSRALVLAHRDELIQQAVDKIRGVIPGAVVGVVQAERDDHWAPIVVASVQTLARIKRLEAVAARPFGLVICDEAHHAAAATYRGVFERLNAGDAFGPVLVGVTATPDRGDRVRLDDVFERIVYEVGLLELIMQGYLCDPRAVRIQLENLNLDAVAARHGDYADGAIAAALENADQPANTALAVKEHASDRKAIVFTASVDLAKETAAELLGLGISAEWVSGEMPTIDRRAVLERFKTGQTQVVTNCMVLTEGFDQPDVDCVVIARPTKSRSLYQQMAGRGLRTAPGKTDCLLIDVVGVTETHDLQSSASLAGIDFAKKVRGDREEGDAEGETMLEAMAKQDRLFTDPVTGRMVAVPVDLFKRSKLAWSRAGAGAWTIPVSSEARLAIVPGSVGFDVLRVSTKDRKVEIVSTGLDAGYAQGMVEEMARTEGAGVLIDRSARWRSSTELSDKQLNWAARLRIDIDALRAEHGGTLTKGALSDAIDARMAERQLRAWLQQPGRAA
jgi:superfamily II DNA or RNA helicase